LASNHSRDSRAIEVFHFGERHPVLHSVARSVGRYDRAEIASILRRFGIQVVLLPSQVHETYGYAMTDAMLGQLPIVASSVGAFPERLAGRGYSQLVDANADLDQWVDAIHQALRNERTGTSLVQSIGGSVESRNFYRSEYL
jgi:glycosyltransferase involved in cell wall biosynthesis